MVSESDKRQLRERKETLEKVIPSTKELMSKDPYRRTRLQPTLDSMEQELKAINTALRAL